MNNQENEKPEHADPAQETGMSEGELLYDAENRDWVLQTLVGICNISGIEISITLNLAGCYVSGYIVKPEVYFDGIRADLEKANFHGGSGNEVKKTLEQVMSSMREMAAPVPGEHESSRRLRPRYIHLRAARFFAPNDVNRQFPVLPKGTWWRGKIASADGFHMGMPFPV